MSVLFYLPKAVAVQSSGIPYASARAYFYETGTTTQKDVFTDSGLSIAFSQPVEADAAGVFPPIYLDPTLIYKLTLKTLADVLIYTVDPIRDGILTQAQIGAILYPRTAAEIAAGVTPTSYAYQAGNVLRYGASTSASAATNSAAFQAALDAHPGLWYCPTGTFAFNVTLTTTPGAFVWMRGEHPRGTVLNWTGGATECINLAEQTEPIFESIAIDNNGTATIGIQCDSLRATFRNLYWAPIIEFTTAAINSRVADAVEMWTLTDIIISGYSGHRSAVGIWLHQGNAFTFRKVICDGLEVGIQAGAANGGGFQSGLVSGLSIGGGCLFQHGSSTSIGVDLYHVQGFEIGGGAIFEFDTTNQLSIKCRTAIGGEIKNCWMNGAGNQNYAIECADSSSAHIDITGNAFDRIVLGGVLISAGTEIWVHNNNLSTCATQAVDTTKSWTPAITIGGSSTGITYTSRVASFERNGNWVSFQGEITLSSKGGLTGSVIITGLPYYNTDTTNNNGVITYGLDASGAIAGFLYGLVLTSTKTVGLYKNTTGTSAALNGTDLTNTSVIFFGGRYQCLDL